MFFPSQGTIDVDTKIFIACNFLETMIVNKDISIITVFETIFTVFETIYISSWLASAYICI